MSNFFILIYFWLIFNNTWQGSTLTLEELKYMPTKCESCRIFSKELELATIKLPSKMVNF